jgi:peptide deformylase
MAILPIITVPDPRLRKVSEPVERVDAEIRRMLDDMLETMYEAPGIGLAAIQVAIPKRMLVVDTGKTPEDRNPMFIVNPEIIWASEELSVYNEGCLSVPEYFEDVKRPAKVRVRHLDREGQTQEFDAEGLLATVVQHEMEHLEGGLFIDHLSRLKRERIVTKLTKTARLNEKLAAIRKTHAEQEAAETEEAGA